MNTRISRRTMLTASAAAAVGVATSTTRALADHHETTKPITLKKGATVLIQGDSITDAGRARDTEGVPNDFKQLGNGYAKLIAYHLLSRYPDKQLKVFNRGISGNKVPDLEARWDKDCLDLKPDVLSILIGVNDYWHTVAFGAKYKGTVKDYETGFNALLKRTTDALPDVQLIIGEPFVVRDVERKTRADWFPEFAERQAVAKATAEKFGAIWVPYQAMFDNAVAAGSDNKAWSGDAVHPNAQGAALMSMRWLGETGLA